MREFANFIQAIILLIGFIGVIFTTTYMTWQLWEPLTLSLLSFFLGFPLIMTVCVVVCLILTAPVYWLIGQLK